MSLSANTERSLDELESLCAQMKQLESGLAIKARNLYRRAGVLAILIATAIATAALTAATSLAAAGSGGEIAVLEGRIKALEQKLLQPLTVKSPFTVVDSGGKQLARIEGAQLQLFNPSQTATITLAAHANRSVIAAGPVNQSTPLLMLDANDNRAYVRVLPAGSGKSQLASLGIDDTGQGRILLRTTSGDRAIRLAVEEDRGLLQVMGKGGKLAASLSGSEDGGTLKTFNKEGNAVAAVFAGSDGGHLVLTGPNGGKTAVGLSVTPSGGNVRVYPAEGGSSRAELISTSTGGALNLFDTAGTNAAAIDVDAGKAGHLEFTNGSGSVVVEAGATRANRLGFVSTGPFDGGVAARQGNIAMPASTLVGRKTGK